MQTYNNPTLGVTVNHPSGWTPKEGGNPLGQSIVFSEGPIDDWTPPDKQPPSMNLTLFPIDPEFSIEEFTSFYLFQLERLFPMSQQPTTTSKNVGGYSGKKCEMKASMGTLTLCFYQEWTIRNGVAYVLGFTAVEEKYQQFKELIEKCFDSLKLTAEPEFGQSANTIETLLLATHCNSKHLFQFRYPNNWSYESRKATAPCLYVGSADYDWFLDNEKRYHLKALVVVESTAATSVEHLAKLYDYQILKQFRGKLKTKLAPFSFGNRPGYLVSYLDPITQEKIIRAFTLHNSKAYSLTLSSTANETEQRDIPIFLRILASFSFISESASRDFAGLTTYENLLYGLSVQFDEDRWDLQEGVGPVTASFIDKRASDPQFSPHVNIMANRLIEKMNIDQFLQLMISQFSALGAFQIESIVESDLGGLRAKLMTNFATLPVQNTELKIKALQKLAVSADHAYVVSYSTTVNQSGWDKSALELINSFRLINLNENPLEKQ